MGTTNTKKTTFKEAWKAARDKWEKNSKQFINKDNNTYNPDIRTLDSTFKFNGKTYNILKEGDNDDIKNAILSSYALGNYITDKNSGMEKEWGITSEDANKIRD
jgi:CTP:phosphocholine cytidylyltransferase-like protein